MWMYTSFMHMYLHTYRYVGGSCIHSNMFAHHVYECTQNSCTCIYTHTDVLEVRVYIWICMRIIYMNVHIIHAHLFTHIEICWMSVYAFEYVCSSYMCIYTHIVCTCTCTPRCTHTHTNSNCTGVAHTLTPAHTVTLSFSLSHTNCLSLTHIHQQESYYSVQMYPAVRT